jgi:hypothetical protein
MSAAERLGRDWVAASREQEFNLSINACVHRGTLCTFRSFLYGTGFSDASDALAISVRRLGGNEGNIFVTGPMQESLHDSPWHARLELLFADLGLARLPEFKVFRLRSDQ